MPGDWITHGFEAFRRGSFGDAGKNLYVSRAGVLQRIHCFDLNGDGYVDLPFCNSQEHWETPPAYVYRDPLAAAEPVELPTEGALSGVVADLNGDGYDDLVLGMFYNGARKDLNAYIYYGSPQGLAETRRQLLPAPQCSAVAAGDFDGDGRPDLAFLCAGKVPLSSIRPSRPLSPRDSSTWRSRARIWRRTTWTVTAMPTWWCGSRTGK